MIQINSPRLLPAALILLLSAILPAFAQDTGAAGDAAADDDGFTELFNGTDTEGWHIRSGSATYEVVDGTIVGTTKEGSPNTFLCSPKQYGDFELHFETKVDDGLNSGVQIRSTLKGEAHGGRLNGPQVEIEKGPGQSGFIYGEATGRGWISTEPKSKDKKVSTHDHFKNGDWNQYRVVAKGNRIQTWVNGEAVADLTDDEIFETHPKGYIGLQVHGIKKGKGPFTAAWRNIKIKEL